MKCTNCDGTGKEKLYDKLTHAYLLIKCAYCNGTGEMPQTNEEWIKSCTTEQLAETLAWIEDRGELPTVCKENVKAFEKWLKQPHAIKE